MDKRIEQLARWYEKRTNRERLGVLLLGVILISFTWYFFLFKPLDIKKDHLKEQTADLKHQLIIYQNKIDFLEIEGPKNVASRKRHAQQLASQQQQMTNMKFEAGSIEYNDELIESIFKQMPNIKVTQLKDENSSGNTTKDTSEQNLEIYFESDYFSTIAYLKNLEKLPWCLSWDTLEYKVTRYPAAAVTLQMHIVTT